jgi:hypothetical protein
MTSRVSSTGYRVLAMAAAVCSGGGVRRVQPRANGACVGAGRASDGVAGADVGDEIRSQRERRAGVSRRSPAS